MAPYLLMMLAATLTSVVSLHDDDIYCTQRYARLCQGKGTHVACRYPVPGPGEDCVNYAQVEMDHEARAYITNYINKRRQRVASGRERVRGGSKIPKPKLMMFVEWDKELALLAQRLADQCQFVHDECRATVRYPHAGQSVGEVRIRKSSDPRAIETMTLKAIRRVLDAWWSEKRRVEIRQLFQPFMMNPRGSVWGHFSQLAVWSLRAVGCGAIRHRRRLLLVCDFSHTNMLGERTLNTGPPAACPGTTHRNPRTIYSQLCRNPDHRDATEYYNDVEETDLSTTTIRPVISRTSTREAREKITEGYLDASDTDDMNGLIERERYIDMNARSQDREESYARKPNVERKFEVYKNKDNYIDLEPVEYDYVKKRVTLDLRTTVGDMIRSGQNNLDDFSKDRKMFEQLGPKLKIRPTTSHEEFGPKRHSTVRYASTEERPIRKKWKQARYRPKRPGATALFTRPLGRFYSRTARVSLMLDKDDHHQFFKDTGFSITISNAKEPNQGNKIE